MTPAELLQLVGAGLFALAILAAVWFVGRKTEAEAMNLQRLVITYGQDGIQLRTLYRRTSGPNPGTVHRRKEVQALAEQGLRDALRAIKEGPVECIGTSGFETREDTLSAGPSYLPVSHNNACTKKGAK